ncbi:MAG: PAS domain-containing protein, partial [Giesbergeria sp.]
MARRPLHIDPALVFELGDTQVPQPQDSELLRVSEAKFSAISLALPDPCGITRVSDGRYIEVNPAFCTLFGEPREKVLGRSAIELG